MELVSVSEIFEVARGGSPRPIQEFITDDDADDTLRTFEKIVKSGRNLAIMAHFNHPAELSTPAVAEAIRRVRSTGAQIRTQSPIMKHINDDADTWATMWRAERWKSL